MAVRPIMPTHTRALHHARPPHFFLSDERTSMFPNCPSQLTIADNA
jgi:hypothetical protein